jgi:aryl-phospho-beta-D-glucosidase BglC (GH1 family)
MKTTFLTFVALFTASTFAQQCTDGIVRGVNVGGLFLLEPWITPSIFEEQTAVTGVEVVDEYTLAQYSDPAYVAQWLDT